MIDLFFSRASTLLCPAIEQHFPFMTKDVNIQITYIKNILRSLSYLSVQRSRFLEIILSKLIRMDVSYSNQGYFLFVSILKVHASRQDILHAEKTNLENELVFSLEQLDTNDNNGMKHDQADKLDCLMFVLFEYITNISIQNGKYFSQKIKSFCKKILLGILNYEQTQSLFRDLLNVFNKILLPTHDSSHVQFLLFHICSFHTVSYKLFSSFWSISTIQVKSSDRVFWNE
jgi:RNA polymerase I-specific transcription initiation factor RRN3